MLLSDEEEEEEEEPAKDKRANLFPVVAINLWFLHLHSSSDAAATSLSATDERSPPFFIIHTSSYGEHLLLS